MSEVQGTLLPAEFNQSIKIEARPERLSADAGALLMRDLMVRPRLPGLVRTHLDDPRDPGRITHPFMELFRTWLCSQSTLSRLLYVLELHPARGSPTPQALPTPS